MQICLPHTTTSHAHQGVLREDLWSGYIKILFHPSPGAIGICVPFICRTMWDHSNDSGKRRPTVLAYKSWQLQVLAEVLTFLSHTTLLDLETQI